MIKVLENEWVPWACANKNGQGDGSGDLPLGALEIAGEYSQTALSHYVSTHPNIELRNQATTSSAEQVANLNDGKLSSRDINTIVSDCLP